MDYKFVNEQRMDIIMAVLSAIFTFLFGDFTIAMMYLIVANTVDVLTGVGKSGRYYRVGSRTLGQGIKKKVGFWVLVFVAHMTDIVLIGEGSFAKNTVIMLLIGAEATSIMENVVAWGVPAPKFLSKYLIQIRDSADKGNLNVQDISDANIVDLDSNDNSSESERG